VLFDDGLHGTDGVDGVPHEQRLVVDLVPRSTANCLDLAVRWVGRNVGRVLRWTLPYAVVAAVLSWWLVDAFAFPLRIVVVVLAVVTWPLGLDVGQRVAAEIFGRERRLRGPQFTRDLFAAAGYRVAEWGGPVLLLYTFDHWLCAVTGLVLYLIVAPRMGLAGSFLAENRVLDRRGTGKVAARTGELIKQERSDLFVRWHWFLVFWGVVTLVLVAGVETCLQSVLQWSAFLGRMNELLGRYMTTDGFGPAFRYVVTSPWAAAVFAFWGVIAYPLIRIAWTFCYADLRIRRDMWDLEQRCLEEARRLDAAVR
jgi:hypothetical protein